MPALAREWLGFTRAFVLTIEEGSLRTLGVDEAPDRSAACGWQPGRALMLRPGSAEAELMLATEQGRAVGRGAPSQLVDQLGLGHAALGAIMPEEHVVAFVVSDRPWPEVTQADRDAVQIFSQLVSAAMETLLLRDRMREFTHELRYLTSSANALLTGAIGVPGAAAATVEPGPAASGAPPFAMEPADRISRLFTKREQDVAEQLVAGQSNRAIAEHLHISPDTVKAYVARVMRKLEASNRADAAVRYLRLSDRRADA